MEVSTKPVMDTSVHRRTKRWSEALKREIVAATLVPGASVSVAARQPKNGVVRQTIIVSLHRQKKHFN